QTSTTWTSTRNSTAPMIPGTSKYASSGLRPAVAAATAGIRNTWAITSSASRTTIIDFNARVARGCMALLSKDDSYLSRNDSQRHRRPASGCRRFPASALREVRIERRVELVSEFGQHRFDLRLDVLRDRRLNLQPVAQQDAAD